MAKRKERFQVDHKDREARRSFLSRPDIQKELAELSPDARKQVVRALLKADLALREDNYIRLQGNGEKDLTPILDRLQERYGALLPGKPPDRINRPARDYDAHVRLLRTWDEREIDNAMQPYGYADLLRQVLIQRVAKPRKLRPAREIATALRLPVRKVQSLISDLHALIEDPPPARRLRQFKAEVAALSEDERKKLSDIIVHKGESDATALRRWLKTLLPDKLKEWKKLKALLERCFDSGDHTAFWEEVDILREAEVAEALKDAAGGILESTPAPVRVTGQIGTFGPLCAFCGCLIPTDRKKARYCSDACKNKAYRARRKQRHGS